MPSYTCDVCGNTLADFMVSAVATGDTVAIGVECLPTWVEALVSALDAAEGRGTEAALPAPETPEPSDTEWEEGYPDAAAMAAAGPRKRGSESFEEEGQEGGAADD